MTATDEAKAADEDVARRVVGGLTVEGVRTPRATIRCRLYDMIGKGHWVDWNGEWATDSRAAWRYPQPVTTPDLAGGDIKPGRFEVTAKGLRPELVESERPDIKGLVSKFVPLATAPLRWAGIAYSAPKLEWYRLYDGSMESTCGALQEDPDPEHILDVWLRADDEHDEPQVLGGHRHRHAVHYTSIAYRPLIMRESQYSARTLWADPDKDTHPVVVRDHRGEVTALVMPVRASEAMLTSWAEAVPS